MSSEGKSPRDAAAGPNYIKSAARAARKSSLELRHDHLALLLDGIKRCNQQVTLADAIATIVTEACTILQCDRATLFVVDEEAEQLVIKVGTDVADIRIPWNAGIAGTVYQTGDTLNIPDAYQEPLFNQNVDKATGYRTTSILCSRVRDSDDKTIAVLQAINKKSVNGTDTLPFADTDETLLSHLAEHMGVVLRNAILKDETMRAHQKVRAMMDIIRQLHGDLGISSLMYAITERTPSLVDADRCTLYLVDKQHKELTSMQGAVEIRFPWDKGLAGHTATKNEVYISKDVYTDARFNQSFDKKSGYRTKSMLILPIHEKQGGTDVIGVLQLINKKHGGVFCEHDADMLMSFLDIAGSVLATSQLFQHTKEKLNEFEQTQAMPGIKGMDSAMGGMVITEGDEDEEEDEEED